MLDGTWAKAWIAECARVAEVHREELIDLDRAIGDGDHGENLYRGFAATQAALDEAGDVTAGGALKIVAKVLISTVGGASGPLYGTAFLRASKAIGDEPVDGEAVAALIEAALEGIQARGKATEGEKTMVDAWSPAAKAARAAATMEPALVFEIAAGAAEEGAEATIPMRATKGRASYLGERSIGHKDPGATSTALILAAAARTAREAAA